MSKIESSKSGGRTGPDVGTLPNPDGDEERSGHLDPEADPTLKMKNMTDYYLDQWKTHLDIFFAK